MLYRAGIRTYLLYIPHSNSYAISIIIQFAFFSQVHVVFIKTCQAINYDISVRLSHLSGQPTFGELSERLSFHSDSSFRNRAGSSILRRQAPRLWLGYSLTGLPCQDLEHISCQHRRLWLLDLTVMQWEASIHVHLVCSNAWTLWQE
ncbi:unnamed protein product [Cercospora beticola]|nr:unnamed protein product [Cercospora beticola]